MRLKDYGRNQRKRKEYIQQDALLLIGVDVSKSKHDACIGTLENVKSRIEFKNARDGFQRFEDAIRKNMFRNRCKRVLIAMEPELNRLLPNKRQLATRLQDHVRVLTRAIGERSVRLPENLEKSAAYIQAQFEAFGLPARRQVPRTPSRPLLPRPPNRPPPRRRACAGPVLRPTRRRPSPCPRLTRDIPCPWTWRRWRTWIALL